MQLTQRRGERSLGGLWRLQAAHEEAQGDEGVAAKVGEEAPAARQEALAVAQEGQLRGNSGDK